MDSMNGFGPFGAGSNPVGGTRIYKEKAKWQQEDLIQKSKKPH